MDEHWNVAIPTLKISPDTSGRGKIALLAILATSNVVLGIY
jgi:hypothetical protein